MRMLSSRRLRSVPLDFDWPLGRVWEGYVSIHLRPPTCPDCSGRYYSPQGLEIMDGFWGEYDTVGWRGELSQEEVDWLLAKGHLRTRVGAAVGQRGTLETLPLSAEYVNRVQREGSPLSAEHYLCGLDQYLLSRRRCEALGHAFECTACGGKGYVGTPDQTAAYDAWEPQDPPPGDGIQLWETASEGSPVSPVFADTPHGRQALAAWLSENHRLGGMQDETTWLALIDSPSHVVSLRTGQIEVA
jgi:hypothetical protein